MPSAKCQFCALNTFRENVWTNKQTNKQTNKNKQTGQLEGYSRHSRQSSLNNSHVRISHCYYIESKCSGSKTD